jgi:hypothetical protein
MKIAIIILSILLVLIIGLLILVLKRVGDLFKWQ